MKNFVIFLLLILFTFSCKKDKSITDTFSNSTKLHHQKLLENEEPIFRNGEMLYFDIDSSLIIQNFKSDSLLMKITLKDKRISHFIPLGNGPDEFVDIHLSQKISDSTLMFMDVNSSKLFQLNIITGELNEDLEYNNSRCLRIVKLNNYHFSTGIFEDGMFGMWKDNDFITYTVDYPKDKVENKNEASKGLAYQGKLLTNDKLNRLLFCSSLFSYFELFEINQENNAINSINKSYIGKYNYVPSQDENVIFARPDKGNKEGYIDAIATNNRIYLLYSGRSIEDPGISSREETRLANQILVYDWDGRPITKYETDVDLKNICINDAGNTIFGIAYTPDPEIVFFKI